MAKPAPPGKPTRIQKERRAAILNAALDVFSEQGLSGATLEQIATKSGLSKQNIIYHFGSKDAIYKALLESLLDLWVSPLRDLSETGDPLEEILGYVQRKLQMSQDMPRESRLFATEIIQGAPRMSQNLSGDLKALVDRKAEIIAGWSTAGRLAPIDPHHLIFAIWSMTQHYADFDVQVASVLGADRDDNRFNEAETFLISFFSRALRP